jgi:PAS domain S-box-containing protein
VLHVGNTGTTARVADALNEASERFTIEPVNTAADAQSRLTDQIDCVIATYELPDKNGLQLLQQVREAHPELPFVLFTDSGSERIASEAIDAGVSAYLPKGVDPDYSELADRIETLVETADADAEQRRNDRYREQLLDVLEDSECPPDEQTTRLLEIGCERFGTENGHLVSIDRGSQRHEVVSVFGTDIVTEEVADLSTTYCRRTIESNDVLDLHDAVEQGWEDDPAYQEYGFSCYIGRKLLVNDELYGTVCFASERSRASFTEAEITFMNTLGRLFSRLLERRRRQTQFETIFEHTQDALFLMDYTRDGEFRLRRVNDVYETMTGRLTADLRGKSLREIVSDEKGAVVEEYCQQCVETREPVQYVEELEVGTKRRHWQTKLTPVIEDGDVVQLVGAMRDISAQVERERKLRVRNGGIETASVGITISDPTQPDNPLIYVNEFYEEMTGYSKEYAIGRNCRFLQGEDTASEPVDTMREAIDNREPVSVELRNYRKDGTEFWNRVNIAPVFDDDGELTHFVGYQQDITEEVEYKRQLEDQNERLETFASMVSHDLRNPLGVAQGRLEIGMDDIENEHLEIVADNLNRMEEIIADLLTLTREPEQKTETGLVALSEFAEECWGHVETDDVRLVVDADHPIEADRDRLAQLLENLIRNAVEHGGDLSTVTIGTFEDGFYVEDDGEGIPPADREEIFEEGYTTSREGTGLGLSIVGALVDSHGWELTLTKGTDGGARFEIRTENKQN